MIQDHELLELAAKAAGLRFVWDYDEYLLGQCIIEEDGFPQEWNPLDDDGDALRLAVKCALKISHTTDSVIVSVNGIVRSVRSYYNGVPNAATRRAIVHAAAWIGNEQTCLDKKEQR